MAPPVALTEVTRLKMVTKLWPGVEIREDAFAIPPTLVTPAMPVQFGIDLIVERAAWFEPARNRLEMFDGNVYLRFVVSRPNVPHAATFAIAHGQGVASFNMTNGPGVAASASAGEGFFAEGSQTATVASGSHHVGLVFVPRSGSWWIMLTSVTKDFLWRLYSADATALS